MSEQNLTEQVVERALADAEFRAQLVADPGAAIVAELGIELPAGLTVRVVEETASEVVLVLPAANGGQTLSEQDLAAAAGGEGSITCVA
jgi:hypothetical protein